MPHALVELGGLRGLLSRLQERPVQREAGERNHAAAVHTQHASHFTPLSRCFHCDKRFVFQLPIDAKKSNKRKLNVTFYRCSLITRLVLLRAAVAQITEAASDRL